MTGQTLGVPARAALLALMASGGESTNVGLRPWLGSDGIRKPVRELLNREQLVASHPDGRSYRHELTAAGWQWCQDELSADGPPPRSGSMGGALYALLQALGGYVKRTGLSLTDLFAPSGHEDIEAAVRAVYQELADFPNDWVRLADVRPKLPDFDRQEVDQMLTEMNRMDDANLAPEPIQGILTDRDREAAVEIGGRANHLLAIDTDG